LRKVSSQIAPNKNTSGQLAEFQAGPGRSAGRASRRAYCCLAGGRDIVRPNRYG